MKNILGSRSWQDFLFRLRFREDDNRTRRAAVRESVFYAAGFVAPDTERIWGPDISHYDGNVDLKKTKDFGASFVIIKGMDGTIPTKYYKENRARAIDAGLLYAPYAWLYPDRLLSCKAQAQAFWNWIKDVPTTLPPCLDFEWTSWAGKPANPNYSDLEKWVSWFTLSSGMRPILYSAAGFLNPLGRMPDSLRSMFAGIWLASYGGLQPTYPFGMNKWDMWQFSANGDALLLCPGDRNKKELDLNYMTAEFYAVYAPPIGGPMHQGTTSTTVKIWMYRGNTQIDEVRSGTTVRGNPPEGDYTFLLEPVVGWTKTMWLKDYKQILTPPPPPAPEPEPTVTLKHTIEVYSDGSIRVDGGPFA